MKGRDDGTRHRRRDGIQNWESRIVDPWANIQVTGSGKIQR